MTLRARECGHEVQPIPPDDDRGSTPVTFYTCGKCARNYTDQEVEDVEAS